MTHRDLIDLARPVRRESPLARGLATWWLSLPGLDGGPRLYDLVGPRHGVLTMSSPAAAWRPALPRPGGLATAAGLPNAVSKIKGPDAPSAAANPYAAVANGGDFTFCHWVRIDARGTTVATLATVHDNAANGVGLVSYAGPGTNAWRVYVASASYDLANVLPVDGTWKHLAIARKAGSLTRYLDGLPVGSPVTATGTTAARADGLAVGNYVPGYGSYQLTGAADDVRYYSRGLSAAEVRALYDDSRRGCPALLRRLTLFPRPSRVVAALPVVPVLSLPMASRRTRDLTARAPRPWDGVAADDRVLRLFARS